MAVIDGYQLEEIIKEFRFNELGGISILKKWRELAVICQIDIEIVSISRDNYRNYASIPANGFYGYATVVLRDFALPPIKITQPRQTLYYARNDAAIANWFTFLQQVRVQENYKAIENLICFNTGLLGGACAVVPCKDIPVFSFDEIPLREVIVKADYGTQFKFEYSFWKLLPELNACGDIITPKSNQGDGSKDTGLPSNGSSPQNRNPSNPYGGLPPADGIDKEGVLSLDKLNNQNTSNPNNAPTVQINRLATSSVQGFYLAYSFSYVDFGTCKRIFGTKYTGSLEGEVLSAGNVLDNAIACGKPVSLRAYSIGSREIYRGYNPSSFSMSAVSNLYGLLPIDGALTEESI